MSSIRLLVLGVVRIFQPVHGYDVRRELLSWRADEWASVQTGSIYNALKTLTRDGLLAVEGTAAVGGRPERTTYRLTAEGEDELRALSREAWWNVQQTIDPLMPALSFLSLLPRGELIAALRGRIVQIEGMVARHEFLLRSEIAGQKPAHVREMFHLMNARLSSETAWATALIAKLEAGEYETADSPAPTRHARAGHASKGKRVKAAKRKPVRKRKGA